MPEWTPQYALWVTVTILDVLTIVRLLLRGHGVEGTLAWLFAILAFPGVGALAYLVLSPPNVRRTTRKKRRAASAFRQALGVRDPTGKVLARAGIPAELESSMLDLAATATGFIPTYGNRVDLLAENVQAFEQIEAVLLSAKDCIWSEYYIIRNDETGRRFLDILAERAEAGVEVRLLYDAVGSSGIDAVRLKRIRQAGGKVEAFLPINPLARRWSIHLRNHRKLIIVDGQVGFTGGMNVGDEYSGRSRRKGARHFHDSHLAVRGPAVQDFSRIFAEDWSFATGQAGLLPEPPEPIDNGTSVVAIVPSGPEQEHNANALVYFAGIASSQEKVYLTSPYFIPDEPMLRALITAAMRGVDVRLIVPAKPDVSVIGPAARTYFPDLVRGGVRIYEYQSMLHAKTMVVDRSWSIVGSANADIRSFRLNFELGALIVDPRFAEALEQRFLADLKSSREVTAASLARRTLPERLRDQLARLLSPLL